ncbi:uncharacterized protein ACIBXB_001020 isoform 1-T2 [Morphnus guianensis]
MQSSLTAENKTTDIKFRLGEYLLHLSLHTMGHRALPVMLRKLYIFSKRSKATVIVGLQEDDGRDQEYQQHPRSFQRTATENSHFFICTDGAVKVDLELDLKTSRYVNLKEGEACQQVSTNKWRHHFWCILWTKRLLASGK